MANICNNYVRIICESDKRAMLLALEINKVLESNKNTKFTNFDALEKYYQLDPSEYMHELYKRASILNVYCCSNECHVEIDSAWSPSVGIVREIAYKCGYEEIYYTSEEFGCDVCISNDPNYIGTYVLYLDSFFEYSLTLQEIEEKILEYCDTNNVCDVKNLLMCSTIEKLVAEVNKYDIDVNFWKYEYEDINDIG